MYLIYTHIGIKIYLAGYDPEDCFDPSFVYVVQYNGTLYKVLARRSISGISCRLYRADNVQIKEEFFPGLNSFSTACAEIVKL